MKALIKVGYGCNNHCSFCHTLDVRHIEDTTDGVHQKIERAAQLGYSMVVLSGGEPTMRPELIRWAKHAKLRNMAFGLVTNGRMLAYPELVDKLMTLGLQYVYMSLHGGTAKIHNALVRADAFDDTFGAVKVLSGRGLDLTVNTVVTRHNVTHLRGVVDSLLGFNDVTLKFSMTQPKGAAHKLFNMVVPKVSDVAESVCDAIAYGQARSNGLSFAHDGIPLCLLPGYEHLYDDLKTHGFAVMTEVFEPDFFPVDAGAVTHTDKCDGCALKGPCVGLFIDYAGNYGDEELRPKVGLRSNSFTYETEKEIPWPDGDACPILNLGSSPFDHLRHLFIKKNEHLSICKTETRDFSDSELNQVKFDYGQIYVDTSTKDAPDDFSRDLRKLEPIDECQQCALSQGCPRAYAVSEQDVFSPDDAYLRGRLSQLRGKVLDVGCGYPLYTELFEQRVTENRLDYVGLDPDRTMIAHHQTNFAWGRWLASDIDTYNGSDGPFDAILILRSYNHLPDPTKTVANLLTYLKPGGELIIADNVAFGLVRSPEHQARAEKSPAIFEHYRNDDSQSARLAVEHLQVSLVDQMDIRRDGSNQWLFIED